MGITRKQKLAKRRPAGAERVGLLTERVGSADRRAQSCAPSHARGIGAIKTQRGPKLLIFQCRALADDPVAD